MKCHPVKSVLEDFVLERKIWLSQNTEELSNEKQEDVFDRAAVNVYCLGGSGTSDIR